jgi:hypothetical protein
MATYQDFTVLTYSRNTSLIGALSDGRKYYIVGASNKNAGSFGVVKDPQNNSLLQIPINGYVSVPGAGIAVDNFKCGDVNVEVLYYIK